MILQALVKKYYECLADAGKVTRPGWCSAKVAASLNISQEGELLGITPLKNEETRGRKPSKCQSQKKYLNRSPGLRAFHQTFCAIIPAIFLESIQRENLSGQKRMF